MISRKLKIFFLLTIIILSIQSSEKPIQTQTNNSPIFNAKKQGESVQKNERDINRDNLVAIERQIALNTQLLELYQQRLDILINLKNQIKKCISQNQIKTNQQRIQLKLQKKQQKKTDVLSNSNVQNTQSQLIDLDSIVPQLQRKQSPFYILQNQYKITHQIKQSQEQTSIQNTQQNKIKNGVIVIPPFIINKQKSYVTVIKNINHLRDQNFLKLKNVYNFANSSYQLLFYHLEEDKRLNKRKRQDKQGYVLNLGLQINPGKVKRVTIRYQEGNSSRQFEVQEHQTSYQSHSLISQTFKVDKGLYFEDVLVGFEKDTIFVKGKDGKVERVEIGSKILGLDSVYQLKLLVICESKIVTLNLKDLGLQQQISFEQYLGNKTLPKRKSIEISHSVSEKSQEQFKTDYIEQPSVQVQFWHLLTSRNHNRIRAVSVDHLEITGQFLVLLSNGDLLLVLNDKITHSTNIGRELMSEFSLQNIKKPSHDKIKTQRQMNIQIETVPGHNYLLITSNYHSKIMVFNISIPHLSQKRGARGFSIFAPSQTNQLKCQFWLQINFWQISLKQKNTAIHSLTQQKNSQFSVYIRPPIFNNKFGGKVHNFNHLADKSVIIYHCLNIQEISQGKVSHSLVIREFKLLLNLFGDSYIDSESLSSVKSQGRPYWWNILTIVLVIIGVIIFRKCKKFTSKNEDFFDFEDFGKYSMPKLRQNQSQCNKKRSSLNRVTTEENGNRNKQKYEDKVIQQLQYYFQKQGQKLSKEQLSHLLSNLEKKQEIKPKIQREEQKIRTRQSFYQNGNDQNLDRDYQNIIKDLYPGQGQPPLWQKDSLSQTKKKNQ